MRVLCIGDIVGRPGRNAVREGLPSIFSQLQVDWVIANAENASGGIGLNVETAKELLSLPINVLTSGNHIWKHKEILPFLDKEPRLLRPLNYPEGTPGSGYGFYQTPTGMTLAIVNLLGVVYMEPVVSPFASIQSILDQLTKETPIILVEMHAEATSEKRALGWYLDGKVSAIYGTHTHVPTADEEILPGGTGYITDIGMTGPYASVIRMKKEEILQRFLTMRPSKFAVASQDIRLCGVILDLDPSTGKTRAIERVRRDLSDL